MVAFRYLRARRAEGFVSVIAIFSLLGIALGVATLIIVMSVMNGFRAELVGRILGLNGHLGRLWRGRAADRFRGRRRARAAGAGGGQRDAADRGAGHGDRRCRRLRRAGARHPPGGHPRAQADRRTISSPARWPNSATTGSRSANAWRGGSGSGSAAAITLISPEGTDTAFGTMPRLKTYTRRGAVQCRVLRIRQQLHLCAAEFGADVLPHARRGQQSRSLCRRTPTACRASGARSRRRSAAGCGLSTGSRPIRAWSTRSRSSAT